MKRIYFTIVLSILVSTVCLSQSIVSIVPSSATAGQTLNVTITGNGTHFQSGTGTTIMFGFEQCSPTIVNSLNITSETSMGANITIPAGVYDLVYDLEVFNSIDGGVVKDYAFGISGGAPCPISLSPNSGAPGQVLNVTITGTGTSFVQASGGSVKIQMDLAQAFCFESSNYFPGTPVTNTLMNFPFTIPALTDTGYYDILIFDQVDVFDPLQNLFHVTLPTGVNETENRFHFEVLPNPFSNETVLRYTLDKSDEVKVEVFDLFGRKIFTEQYGKQKAGTHNEKINAAELKISNGVYLLKFSAGNKKSTRKIVVNR